jgi:hypothetical protein
MSLVFLEVFNAKIVIFWTEKGLFQEKLDFLTNFKAESFGRSEKSLNFASEFMLKDYL